MDSAEERARVKAQNDLLQREISMLEAKRLKKEAQLKRAREEWARLISQQEELQRQLTLSQSIGSSISLEADLTPRKISDVSEISSYFPPSHESKLEFEFSQITEIPATQNVPDPYLKRFMMRKEKLREDDLKKTAGFDFPRQEKASVSPLRASSRKFFKLDYKKLRN